MGTLTGTFLGLVLYWPVLSWSADSTICIGPENAKHFSVYLHGMDSEQPSQQELENRRILETIAKNLNLRIAVPRAQEKCNQSICWGWAITDEVATKSISVIESAAASCFGKEKNFGLIGFSSGGYLASKLFRSCLNPKGARWTVTSGSTMMKGPIEPSPENLSDCGKLTMLIGNKDKHNNDPLKNYFVRLKAKKAKVEYVEFDGEHELKEKPLQNAIATQIKSTNSKSR